jgi:hypothetical protein
VADFRPAGWTGASGASPLPPTVTLQRRRSPVLLVLGIVLVVGAAVGLAVSIVVMVTTLGFDDDDVVAEGVVGALDGDGGEPTTFTAGGDEAFTVWIQTDGINEENRRDNVVAATKCVVDLPNGDQADFRGNRQGNALTIEDDSTVGWFTASEGQNTVACHQERFGRQPTWLDDEHGFVVVRGKPASPLGGILTIGLSVVALLLGIGSLTRWRRGRAVTA